jgi:hypothetical protein
MPPLIEQHRRLNSEKAKLEQLERKKSLNPIKLVSTYRSIRLLAEAARALWLQTRVSACGLDHYHIHDLGSQSSSERVRRRLLSVHAAQDIVIQPVDCLFDSCSCLQL